MVTFNTTFPRPQAPAGTESAPTDVYVVFGVEPEVQAYAMAKYSRSALSMRESLAELNEQRAEKFLNTFYFQYGHRSIADLAHIAIAVERLSILAAIVLADEQRWDGQERSTRYQDFRKSGYYTPDFAGDAASEQLYRETAELLFAEYDELSEQMFQHLAARTPRPEDMKAEQYERTLRARAFDISRYLLPLATNTSLGQIVNARTLESQISRLLSYPLPEIQRLGERLKAAAREPAYNLNNERWRKLVDEIRSLDGALGDRAEAELIKAVRAAPTLVKYAEANPYEQQTCGVLAQATAELMDNAPIERAPLVDLLEDEPLEVELATTLLYEHCHYPYRQLRKRVEALSEAQRNEIIGLGTQYRGKHDELLRNFSAGQKFRFDILMDIGGYRDMHRHRRCVQIAQDFTTRHGYDVPADITSTLQQRYNSTMRRAADAAQQLDQKHAGTGGYLLPLAYRKRTLFKMDFAEAVYITELRTTVAGHFSYRDVAYAMYEAVAQRYPSLKAHFRVTNVREPVDLLKR